MLESCSRSWIFSSYLQETETRKDDLYPCAAGRAGVLFQNLNIFPLFKNHSRAQLNAGILFQKLNAFPSLQETEARKDDLYPCWSRIPEAEYFPLWYRKQRRERTTFTRAQLDVLESYSRSWIFPLCTGNRDEDGRPLPVLESYSRSWIFPLFTGNRDEKGRPLPVRSWTCWSRFPEAESLCSKTILGRSLTCWNPVPEAEFFPLFTGNRDENGRSLPVRSWTC